MKPLGIFMDSSGTWKWPSEMRGELAILNVGFAIYPMPHMGGKSHSERPNGRFIAWGLPH